jgi:hypothetical protein
VSRYAALEFFIRCRILSPILAPAGDACTNISKQLSFASASRVSDYWLNTSHNKSSA